MSIPKELMFYEIKRILGPDYTVSVSEHYVFMEEYLYPEINPDYLQINIMPKNISLKSVNYIDYTAIVYNLHTGKVEIKWAGDEYLHFLNGGIKEAIEFIKTKI